MVSRDCPHREEGARTKAVGKEKERIHFIVKSKE